MSDTKIMDRPIPTLAQWLGEEEGNRSDGFEAWVRETVFLERHAADEDEASCIRMQRTLAIAFLEAMRIEDQQHGRPWEETVLLASRVAGAAAFGALLSGLDADRSPPLLRLARLIAEEFAFGAKSMAKAALSANAIAADNKGGRT